MAYAFTTGLNMYSEIFLVFHSETIQAINTTQQARSKKKDNFTNACQRVYHVNMLHFN